MLTALATINKAANDQGRYHYNYQEGINVNKKLMCAIGINAVLALTTTLALAQSNGGTYKNLLVRALEAAAGGNCPDDIMSPLLQDTCERQMPQMANTLDGLGKIKDTVFKGNQQTPSGPAEVYRVRFERGTMTWVINTGSDGKIVVLWSGG